MRARADSQLVVEWQHPWSLSHNVTAWAYFVVTGGVSGHYSVTCSFLFLFSFRSQVVCFTVRRVLNAYVGQSLVHKRETGSFVTTLSNTYHYDHQATDGSNTGSQNIRGSKVGNSGRSLAT